MNILLFFISVIILFVIIRVIQTDANGRYAHILLLGLFMRLLLLICTCLDIIDIPDAHTDADDFHDLAVANQGEPFQNWDKDTNYTDFLSILYSVTESARWFAQYINLVLGSILLIYLRKILFTITITNERRKHILYVASLMPFSIIYSVVLMREAWVALFVTCSIYHFICWYLQKGNTVRRIIYSMVCVLLAMWMHAGTAGILVGYFCAFLTYYRNTNKIKISTSSYVAFAVVGVFCLVLVAYLDVFASKLLPSDTLEYIQTKSDGEGGGSDYLTWLTLSSPTQVLLFSPLKIFYFLFSPIPIDWRGLNDIAAFFMDSLIYILAIWIIAFKRVSNLKYKYLKRFLFLSFFITVFLFSFGTSNTGTAIRHREKICSLMFVLWALSDSNGRKTCKINQPRSEING